MRGRVSSRAFLGASLDIGLGRMAQSPDIDVSSAASCRTSKGRAFMRSKTPGRTETPWGRDASGMEMPGGDRERQAEFDWHCLPSRRHCSAARVNHFIEKLRPATAGSIVLSDRASDMPYRCGARMRKVAARRYGSRPLAEASGLPNGPVGERVRRWVAGSLGRSGCSGCWVARLGRWFAGDRSR
jgi:hypothetical protein